jgi:hypothetical protein
MNKIISLFLGLFVALPGTSVLAEPGLLAELTQDKVLRLQYSPYTQHYSPSAEHKHVVMLGVERESANAGLDGVTLFSNSFGQTTLYLYPWGHIYKSVGGVQGLAFKWTAGLLYGYRQPYENKVPMNYNGFSPAVIPAVVYEFQSGWSVQANILGTAGMMFQLSAPLK